MIKFYNMVAKDVIYFHIGNDQILKYDQGCILFSHNAVIKAV